MNTAAAGDWSPADNPYAIAVSQSRLWLDLVCLTIKRMAKAENRTDNIFGAQQLDAHVLIMTLRQLLTAEQLEQAALASLEMDAAVRDALSEARKDFETALPGVKDMRDALMHFDEWSRGLGRGLQRDRVKAGHALRDVARDYWDFGYDPATGVVTFGPHSVGLATAEHASRALCGAIYAAAHAVDVRNTAELRGATIMALEREGLHRDKPGAPVKISPGTDLRIWLSLDLATRPDEVGRREISERLVAALAHGGLGLRSTDFAESADPATCLARGEMLCVVRPSRPGS